MMYMWAKLAKALGVSGLLQNSAFALSALMTSDLGPLTIVCCLFLCISVCGLSRMSHKTLQILARVSALCLLGLYGRALINLQTAPSFAKTCYVFSKCKTLLNFFVSN